MTLYIEYGKDIADLFGLGDDLPDTRALNMRVYDVGTITGVDGNEQPITTEEPGDDGRKNILIDVPYIQFQQHTAERFASLSPTKEYQIVMGNVGSPDKYDIKTFYEDYMNKLLQYKTGRVNRGSKNLLNTDDVRQHIINLLQQHSEQRMVTDQWNPTTQQHDIVYNSYGGEEYTKNPVVENNNQHPYHNLLKESDDSAKEKVVKHFRQFKEIIAGERRKKYYDYCLDFSIASLFKHVLTTNRVKSINFPILTIVGEAESGKTWIAERIMKIFFGNASDNEYMWSQNTFSGSSPMTRVPREHNSTLPVMFEEVTDLNNFSNIVNKYLTQGYFSDSIGTSENVQIERKSFRSPIITTNSINLKQKNSEARTQRFAIMELNEPPVSDNELQKKTEKFESYWSRERVQSVGSAIFDIIEDNFQVWLSRVQKQLQDIPQLQKMSKRNKCKLRYFLFGRFIKQKIGEELPGEDNPLAPIADLDDYVQLIVDNDAEAVLSNKKAIEKKMRDVIFSKSYGYGDENLFYNQVTTISQTVHSNVTNQNYKTQGVQEALRYYFYLDNGLGLTPLKKHGMFKVNKDFVDKISTNNFNVTIKKFSKIFSDYTDMVGSARTMKPKKQGQGQYQWEEKMASRVCKFDLITWIYDNRDM